MTSMHRQITLGILAATGAAVTWYFNVMFFAEHGGFPVARFVADNFASNASASISSDILAVVAAFLVWSYCEARRLEMRRWWVYALLTFGVALAFSFPLFLLMRERKLFERHTGEGKAVS